MKQWLKLLVFRLLRKHREAVVVSFWSGEDALAARMVQEIRQLVPDHRHFVVRIGDDLAPGTTWQLYRQVRRRLDGFRIGLAPVLLDGNPHPLRLIAFLLAPHKILTYNVHLERHHLRLSTLIASLLFLRGLPVDRIFLRPRWLYPWKRDRSVYPTGYRVIEGRPRSHGCSLGVLSPYSPYPLSHGGAVRIFHMLREASQRFDVVLFAFSEGETEEDYGRLTEYCARVILVPKTRYREPRWSTLLPPEVHEFRSPTMRRLLREHKVDLLQVEYTHLASYGGDILVEHDVTFDLFGQVLERERTLSALWDFLRWQRFERRVTKRYRALLAMSGKDARLLGNGPRIHVMENGVDLERFQPQPEQPGQRLLFIGSFRHFPNIEAYRFFTERVWPGLCLRFPRMSLTVVAGPDHLIYWRAFTGGTAPPFDDRIRLLGFVADVRPLYVEANLVIVPTTVSAGTNVKVLEAMAMERAIVSTTCGCAGLGLAHGASVWIADSPEDFARGVAHLVEHPDARMSLARTARAHAEAHFDWKAIGAKYRELLLDFAQVSPRRRGTRA